MNNVGSKRILITLVALVVYQITRYIPVFGISYQDFFSIAKGVIPNRLSILALGLMPYISAYVIVMLLTCVIPYFVRIIEKQGLNSIKLNRFVIYGILLLAVIQSYFLSLWIIKLPSQGRLPTIQLPVNLFILITTLTLTIGVFFIVWLGKIITKYGVGNGISLLIIIPIIERIFGGFFNAWLYSEAHDNRITFLFFFGMIIVLAWIIKYILQYKKKISIRLSNRNDDVAFLFGISLLWQFLPYWLKLPCFQSNSEDLILIIGVSLALWRTITNRRYQKEVYHHNDMEKILIAKALLEGKGINIFVDDVESYGRLLPVTVGQLGLKRILVEETSFIEAGEIVSKIS